MVYTIGEIVVDLIFKSFDNIKAKPGGSMLNTAISLGRLGVKVHHVSTLSTDKASGLLINFIEENKVGTNFIFRSELIKTSLALAFLDKNNNAEYTFYKDKLESEVKLKFPEINNLDIIHYGSFFSINPTVHLQLHQFLNNLNSREALKIYDPNFRKPHLPQLTQLMPMLENNFNKADIVKASDEDFENIFGLKTGRDAWKKMEEYNVKILFYTKGDKGSEIFTRQGNLNIKADKINVVSTIGAGDTFTAGIIYFLNKQLLKVKGIDDISLYSWLECLELAQNFAARTCQSYDNYLSNDFCKTFR